MTKTAVIRAAALSSCGLYRYRLWRTWGTGEAVVFIMLNPSTADAEQDDPTIRRCMGFARSWGYDGLVVVNLFALRSTDPKLLEKSSYDFAVGPENDACIEEVTESAGLIVAAWGKPSGKLATVVNYRIREVLGMARRQKLRLHVLGLNKKGEPCPAHPLYQPKDRKPQFWMEVR